ncbi:MAG: iron ABC transporter permease [Gemmatimonadetes bacterium]|nr:iron ABC transporter permease [Gemmatimonadota bacterium]MYK38746.1 iron ABC transporter permease [Gemmatimonadota bacterium]
MTSIEAADPSLRQASRRLLPKVSVGEKGTLGLMVLTVLLGLLSVVCLGTGAVPIGPRQVLAILGKGLDLTLPWAFEPHHEAIVLSIRLPRILLGILIGGGLAVAGAAMQGLFRNPLADPGLIGVSSGAAVAAVATIVLGATVLDFATQALGPFALSIAAFGGGAATTLLVYRLSLVHGTVSVSTMLLAGIAINAVAGAITGVFTFVADDAQLRSLTFWSMGSLGGATWPAVAAAAPFTGLATLAVLRYARPLNALLLGEAEAGHLGCNVERLKRSVVLLVALSVGAAVAVAGIIGFVGLVVPHLLRLTLGPDHRFLLPGAALLGASLLLGADLIARTLVAPAELPIGIVTAIIGGPFFMYLLQRGRRLGKF